MNNRADPWRQKPTTEINSLILEAMEIRLYLLQELGPTSFVFKDDDGNKFRVTIGSRVSCSCNLHKNDQCVHSLYVFLRIYQYNMENPLIWQTAYIDSEINEIIRNRYNPRASQKPKKALPNLKKRALSNPRSRTASIARQELDNEDICSICHEMMQEEEGLTWCKKKCGNNFHLKCILIWAEHKQQTGDKINCPMCRIDWGSRALEALKEEMDEFESRLILHKGKKCGACKSYGQKCIKGKIFHCLYCENFELCEKCFLSYEHYEHNKYLVKELSTDGWRPAKNRDSVYLKKNKQTYQFIKEVSNVEKCPGVDYRIALLNLNVANYQNQTDDKKMSDNICIDDDLCMEDFMISCFPDFASDLDLYQGRKNALAIIGRDMRKNCIVCNSEKGERVKLKRLFCGHIIHEACIMELFSNKKLTCPEDGVELLKGFKTAFFPEMSTTPPTVIEIYQKNPEKMVSAYRKPNKSMPPIKKVTSPKPMTSTRLQPLELDVTGKNLIKVVENEKQPDSMQNTVSIDRKTGGGGLRLLRPPRNPMYLIRNKERTRALVGPMTSFEVQGTMINTNPSSEKIGLRRHLESTYDDDGAPPSGRYEPGSQRVTVGSKISVGRQEFGNDENEYPNEPLEEVPEGMYDHQQCYQSVHCILYFAI